MRRRGDALLRMSLGHVPVQTLHCRQTQNVLSAGEERSADVLKCRFCTCWGCAEFACSFLARVIAPPMGECVRIQLYFDKTTVAKTTDASRQRAKTAL